MAVIVTSVDTLAIGVDVVSIVDGFSVGALDASEPAPTAVAKMVPALLTLIERTSL